MTVLCLSFAFFDRSYCKMFKENILRKQFDFVASGGMDANLMVREVKFASAFQLIAKCFKEMSPGVSIRRLKREQN